MEHQNIAKSTRFKSMTKERIRDAIRRLLTIAFDIVDKGTLYEWQRGPRGARTHKPSELPPGADFLRWDNPVLRSLQQRYAAFEKTVTMPLIWQPDKVHEEEIRYFRGDNAYVWQLRGQNMNPLGYALTTYYVLALDILDLLERLNEDDAFGIYTFQIAGRTVSRDLLDSVIELYFLDKHLQIASRPSVRILDIGAGYGRFAHRAVMAFPNVQFFCTDAVAVSTFICDYYLRWRGVQDRAVTVSLDQIQEALQETPADVAVNIHSFSECRIEAIDWWIALLSKHKVNYLMIVPNSINANGAELRTNDFKEFQPVVERHGYRLIVKEPKYRDQVVQQYGLNPTYHYLFALG
jgi:hypothetical protein